MLKTKTDNALVVLFDVKVSITLWILIIYFKNLDKITKH